MLRSIYFILIVFTVGVVSLGVFVRVSMKLFSFQGAPKWYLCVISSRGLSVEMHHRTHSLDECTACVMCVFVRMCV